MNKPRKPWRCSHDGRCEQPKSFCIHCSHAKFRGQATINGKRYRWVWEPSYYVIWFEGSGTGNWHPSSTHPVWKAVEKWVNRLTGQSAKKDGKQ
jgi:hypothetical protein